MITEEIDFNFYEFSGALGIDSSSYIERDADRELYQALRSGELCYVLNPRQIGKSSLRLRTMKKLQDDGIAFGVIELTSVGSQEVSASEWYLSIIRQLVNSLGIKIDIRFWWKEHEGTSPIDRFREFIEEIILREISKEIVIFVDEIDKILQITFKDDFFGFIRFCYQNRRENRDYHRLKFCLLGVATPSELIGNKYQTSFNVGRLIKIENFTWEQIQPLAKGLKNSVENHLQVFKEIFEWTNGQPFLIQKLCSKILELENPNIDELVKDFVIDDDNPAHLSTIRERLISEQVQNRSGRLLSIYQQILTNGQIPADNSPDQMELQLSGLVVKENGHLKVYNPIYKEVFNLNWVQQQLANLRPYQENFQAWIESDKKDDSRLLRGEALTEALKWRKDKRLSDDDTAFFEASRDYQVEEHKQAEAKAKEIIKAAQEGTKIERLGVQALRRFNTKIGQFQALRDAKKAGEDLQKLLEKWENLVKDNSELAAESIAASPLLALQTILSKIRERHTFSGHTDSVTSVSFSPDGKFLATGSDDNTAKLWDLSGNLIADFVGYQDGGQFIDIESPVLSVSFTPDGKYLAAGYADGVVRLWPIENLNQLLARAREWLQFD